MIKKLIQKIKCSIPFSLNHFWHENVVVVRQLSDQQQLIQCQDCGKLFAINHNVRVILPWEDVKDHYELMNSLTSALTGPEKAPDRAAELNIERTL